MFDLPLPFPPRRVWFLVILVRINRSCNLASTGSEGALQRTDPQCRYQRPTVELPSTGEKPPWSSRASDYQRLKQPGNSLTEFMRNSPLAGVELEIERDASLPREVDL